ncbi:hypothetical protein [Chitinophaga arvensicola]|uniref:Uncharacterized protein n=1 Tax=Chitinophaga arvensicola TaxID=29529 RepID=A0A1I0R988_9BACT|nr:hypothetical protein [Chitinophaga arvensicola]SEW37329.1 hypothetical protein SAMN04488122_2496 [Chitinophaga arvensicola]
MQVSIKITAADIYNQEVLDVITRFHRFDGKAWYGKIIIETETGGTVALDGRHEYNDYEAQYGFIIIAE